MNEAMNDTQRFLRQYVEEGSDSAFQELVRLYIDLVYSVALRRASGDVHSAEDIVQTVFTDLARKASDLPPNVMLGGWLHRHCCFVASTFRRTEIRRQAREREALQMDISENSPEGSWAELAPILDDAIQDLEPTDRDAITLRYFERRNLRSIGEWFGTSEDAAQKRVSRALEKLRHLLAERGVALSVAALGAFLETNSVNAAPVEWAARIGKNALTNASAPAGLLAGAAALFSASALKIAAVALVCAGLASAFLLKTGLRPAEALQSSTPKSSAMTSERKQPLSFSQNIAAKSAGNRSTTVAEKAAQASGNGLLLTLISAETGQPIPNAPVEFRGWQADKFLKGRFVTDAEGRCFVEFPRASSTDVQITTRVSPFADTCLHWRPKQGDSIPPEYTLRLDKGVPIGGTVVNEQNEPVEGAKVGFNLHTSGQLGSAIESHNFNWIEVQTDAAGRWSIDRIGEDVFRAIYGGAQHPEYVYSPGVDLSNSGVAENELRNGSHIFRLGNAVTVRGLVLDKDRNPIPSATVLVGPRGMVGSRESTTALDGTFEARGVKPGTNLVTAQAPQFAPRTIQIVASTDAPPVEVTLDVGHVLRLRVTNKAGDPIPKANVWLDTMDRTPDGSVTSVQAEFSPKTDQDGLVFWDQAPAGELKFSIAATGYMRRDDIQFQADGTEHVVVLQNGLRIHGTVKDAEKDSPISNFRIVSGWPENSPFDQKVVPRWSDLDRYTLRFTGGQFDYTFDEPVIYGTKEIRYIFKFVADDYAPFISRAIDASETDVSFEIKLKPARPLAITLLNPDGTPAANTDVVFANSGQQLTVGDSGFLRDQGPIDTVTDQNGRIHWQPEDTIVMVYAANRAGFAAVHPSALTDNPTLQLQRWGRIEGSYKKKGKPVPDRAMVLDSHTTPGAPVPWLHLDTKPKTDSEGRFLFPQVPPMKWKLCYLAPNGPRSSTYIPIEELDVKAGETTTVEHSEDGVDVIARVRFPEGVTRGKDDHFFAMLHTPAPEPPADLTKDPEALRRWRETPEIMAQLKTVKSWMMQESPEGVFKAEAIPPGTYWVNFNLGRPQAAGEMVSARQMISISGDEPNGILDLNEVALHKMAIPAAARPN